MLAERTTLGHTARQFGRVVARDYGEVVTERLDDGSRQLGLAGAVVREHRSGQR
jgi:hypothetical protein